MKTITIGVSGAIGASNIEPFLIVLSKRYKINLILTEHAQQFVSKNIIKYYAETVYVDFINDDKTITHTYLGQSCDLFLLFPATANIIGKVANGIADDLLTSSVLNYTGKLVIAPNMNPTMWANPIVQRNVETLKSFGHLFVNQKRMSYIVCNSKYEEIDCALPSPKELYHILEELEF